MRDPYLDAAAARSCVEAILEQLRAGHLTITENYERVQLTTTTIKRVQRQWERVQRDARKVGCLRRFGYVLWWFLGDEAILPRCLTLPFHVPYPTFFCAHISVLYRHIYV